MKKDDNLNESSNKLIKNQKINVWSLFKYPSIRYRFLILNILWMGTNASYNGMAISSKSFPGNFYVNIIILFTIEAISFFTTGLLIDIKKIGRRGALWIEYVVVIIVFILLAFLDLNTAGNLTLNYITRFCCGGIAVVYYTYSIELYPTPVRSLAFGINTTFGNLGSIGAPYLLEFLKNWQFLILLDALCVINAIGLIFLPETVGKPMVESIQELDIENNIENNKEEKNLEDNDNKEDKKSENKTENNILSLKNQNKY